MLDGAVAAPDRVVRRLDPGPNADPFVSAIFACFELFLSAVYAGIAERALEVAIDAATARTSARTGRPRSEDPGVRRRIAEAALALDGVAPQLVGLARDLADGTDHGEYWFALLSGAKVRTVQTAREVVDAAVRVVGGATYFAGNELGRLQRDVLAGVFHPSSDDGALATIANARLGPLPD
ncbi:hypothetical protein GCM10025870_28550 [Agromyces marinus]|uniref:Acyl-CoA dehydrogenase C-terminal domain-containing protein n=1 Tax=Agromyces marinus TaxID=1389020 RepID=A0ABN6YEA7_9MICO|nr:hypothetical protein GCM10025870_28550 [Agromyces marinus]